MTTYFIHDSRFILDTKRTNDYYFIHDSRFILDTNRTHDHILVSV
jgi:hypothetical protein